MPATLKSRFPEIEVRLAKGVSNAVKDGAEDIAESARQKVHVRSGELQNRIHVERQGAAEYAVVAGDSEAFYGHMLENGTDIAPPYPFLMPAAEENKHEIAVQVQLVLKSL